MQISMSLNSLFYRSPRRAHLWVEWHHKYTRKSFQTSCIFGLPINTRINMYTQHFISLIFDYRQVRLFGDINTTTGEPHPHFPYIDGTRTTSYYRLYNNNSTRYFPRSFNSREIFRGINVYCLSGTHAKYDVVIPLQDMTPPAFEEEFYSISITTGWGNVRPISEGQFIIVSDNDYELGREELDKNLVFQTPNNEGLLRIEPVKLWVEPNPEKFYYRLDLFLERDLPPGKIQVPLSASDDFNSGSTIVEITVT
ncbi:hypothetical protein Ocin01_09538 [Orchesella cincta]|uniref:Uncharacterized protein n=1 Tax=Orchesella cincta TaxID=48709 RepID=A0A1D2MWF2_ORCCI|nr:hypothetical protein Ocin01_09538 [Orchesella cincta]